MKKHLHALLSLACFLPLLACSLLLSGCGQKKNPEVPYAILPDACIYAKFSYELHDAILFPVLDELQKEMMKDTDQTTLETANAIRQFLALFPQDTIRSLQISFSAPPQDGDLKEGLLLALETKKPISLNAIQQFLERAPRTIDANISKKLRCVLTAPDTLELNQKLLLKQRKTLLLIGLASTVKATEQRIAEKNATGIAPSMMANAKDSSQFAYCEFRLTRDLSAKIQKNWGVNPMANDGKIQAGIHIPRAITYSLKQKAMSVNTLLRLEFVHESQAESMLGTVLFGAQISKEKLLEKITDESIKSRLENWIPNKHIVQNKNAVEWTESRPWLGVKATEQLVRKTAGKAIREAREKYQVKRQKPAEEQTP